MRYLHSIANAFAPRHLRAVVLICVSLISSCGRLQGDLAGIAPVQRLPEPRTEEPYQIQLVIEYFEDARGFPEDQTRFVNSKSCASNLKAYLDQRRLFSRVNVMNRAGAACDLVFHVKMEQFGWREYSEAPILAAAATLGLSTLVWNSWPIVVRGRFQYIVYNARTPSHILCSGVASTEKRHKIGIFSGSASHGRALALNSLYGDALADLYEQMVRDLEEQSSALAGLQERRPRKSEIVHSGPSSVMPPVSIPDAEQVHPPRKTNSVLPLTPRDLDPLFRENRWTALLIGVNQYRNPDLALEAPVNDTTALGQLLEKQFGFHVRYLLNEEATFRKIREVIHELHESSGPGDNILIYYAGHGYVEQGLGYWMPADAYDARDGITNVEIKNLLANLPARRVLLISDSCYSGDFLRVRALPRDVTLGEEPAPLLDPREIQRYSRELIQNTYPSREVISSGNMAPVPDTGTGFCARHSPFACVLLQTLANTPIHAPIGSVDLYAELLWNLRQDPVARQRPHFGSFEGHLGGEFFMIRRTDYIED